MTRRILLHVGTPKTGTSSLQDVLFRNRARLREAGILYPADRFDAHFLAALDLMRLPWGGLEEEAIGAWDRLAEEVRTATDVHTVVISHEILARAGRAHVERALSSLGRDDGAEIHVVISARDLTRQIPAEWQENVKHRASLTYRAFLDQITAAERTGRIGSWFWGVQELPDILERWAGDLPAERVQVVTVPPPGAEPGLLWERFVAAFGLAGIDLDLGNDRSNPSLGVPETALIRRINETMTAHVAPADYRPLVREALAHQTLAHRRGSARLSLPPDLRGWVGDREDAWAAALGERGYRIVGDLDDLRGEHRTPPVDAETWNDPDHPDPAEVADAAVDAIGRLLTDAVAARRTEERLAAELDGLRHELEQAHLQLTYRVRKRIVRGLEESRPGRGALRAYRSVLRR